MKNKLLNAVIIFTLFLLWFFFGMFLNPDASFLTLIYNHPYSSYTQFPSGRLVKGKIAQGQFIADENNLGIITVRLSPQETFSEDTLLFRIREKGQKEWYQTNTYRTGILEGFTFYPFGFSPIASSKDRIYEFQIESLGGNQDNAIALSKSYPVFQTKYVYTKSDFLSKKSKYWEFYNKKNSYVYY